jgi:predicted metalloendopeptidase
MGVHQDNKDSTRYIVDISQSGLGMPNRDLLPAGRSAPGRHPRQVPGHIEKMLALAGHADAAAEAAPSSRWKPRSRARSGAPSRTAIRSRATTR